MLDEVLRDAGEGGAVLVIPRFLSMIETRLGKPLALSTVYRLLARHGWRKLAPNTQHPQGGSARREDWKKLPVTLTETLASFASVQPARLMFQDEARFGGISDGRRCWCKKPQCPFVKAMLTHPYTYVYATISPGDGALDSLVLPHVNTACL